MPPPQQQPQQVPVYYEMAVPAPSAAAYPQQPIQSVPQPYQAALPASDLNWSSNPLAATTSQQYQPIPQRGVPLDQQPNVVSAASYGNAPVAPNPYTVNGAVPPRKRQNYAAPVAFAIPKRTVTVKKVELTEKGNLQSWYFYSQRCSVYWSSRFSKTRFLQSTFPCHPVSSISARSNAVGRSKTCATREDRRSQTGTDFHTDFANFSCCGTGTNSAATCDPNDFPSMGYTLRPSEMGRETELFIVMTM